MLSDEIQKDAPTDEEDSQHTHSLEMFSAAIGGALLGMIWVFLTLAIVHGGTLRFDTYYDRVVDSIRQDERMDAIELRLRDLEESQ